MDDFDAEFNWPKELLPIMVNVEEEERLNRIEQVKQGLLLQPSSFVQKPKSTNRFFSICDKVKAYILAQNFCQVVEKYTQKKGQGSCSVGMFHRALAEWRLSKLFSFRDAQSVTTNKDLAD